MNDVTGLCRECSKDQRVYVLMGKTNANKQKELVSVIDILNLFQIVVCSTSLLGPAFHLVSDGQVRQSNGNYLKCRLYEYSSVSNRYSSVSNRYSTLPGTLFGSVGGLCFPSGRIKRCCTGRLFGDSLQELEIFLV